MNVFNILAIVATFGVGFFLRLRLKKDIPAFLAACGVLPVWILFAEFALPYQGGGASFWPIAVVYGLVVGSLVGGLGVFLGRLWSGERTAAKKRVDPENPPPLALGAAEVEIDIGHLGGEEHREAFATIFERMLRDNASLFAGRQLVGAQGRRPIAWHLAAPPFPAAELTGEKAKEVARALYDSHNEQVDLEFSGQDRTILLVVGFDNPRFCIR